jgi:L-fucose mutarotase
MKRSDDQYACVLEKGVNEMLKGIPSILSPELLKVLMEMGHGDEIVLADGNFPAASIARRLVRLDGHDIPNILESVLKLFPLDTYVVKPVALMAVTPGDKIQPVIWEKYKKVILASKEPFADFEFVERFAFYERARNAYAVVATGESALYANIILKKGVVVK